MLGSKISQAKNERFICQVYIYPAGVDSVKTKMRKVNKKMPKLIDIQVENGKIILNTI